MFEVSEVASRRRRRSTLTRQQRVRRRILGRGAGAPDASRRGSGRPAATSSRAALAARLDFGFYAKRGSAEGGGPGTPGHAALRPPPTPAAKRRPPPTIARKAVAGLSQSPPRPGLPRAAIDFHPTRCSAGSSGPLYVRVSGPAARWISGSAARRLGGSATRRLSVSAAQRFSGSAAVTL